MPAKNVFARVKSNVFFAAFCLGLSVACPVHAQEATEPSHIPLPKQDTPEAWLARASTARERAREAFEFYSKNPSKSANDRLQELSAITCSVDGETIGRLRKFGKVAVPVCVRDVSKNPAQSAIAITILSDIGEAAVAPVVAAMPAQFDINSPYMSFFENVQCNPINELARLVVSPSESLGVRRRALKVMAYFIAPSGDPPPGRLLILTPGAIDFKYREPLLAMLNAAKSGDEKVELLQVQKYFVPLHDLSIAPVIQELCPSTLSSAAYSSESRSVAASILQVILADADTAATSRVQIETALVNILIANEPDKVKIACAGAAGKAISTLSPTLIPALRKCENEMSRPLRLAVLKALSALAIANVDCLNDLAISLSEDDENTRGEAQLVYDNMDPVRQKLVKNLQKSVVLQ